MAWINNLKTGVRLFGGFAILVIIMFAISSAGYSGMKAINDDMDALYHDNTLPIEQISAAQTALFTMRGDLYKYVFIPEERAKTKAAISADEKVILDNIAL